MDGKYSKITLLVDMDDTIEDLLPAWVGWLNAANRLHVDAESITDWNIAKFFPTLNEEDIYSPLVTEKFWQTVKPKLGAATYLKKLVADGFNLYICTCSSYLTIRTKLDCILGRYFPFIPYDRVITIRDKQLLNGDILVDDGIHNLIGGNYVKLLMTAPHNKLYDAESNGMVRVDNWGEAYNQIIKYANQILNTKNGGNNG